MSSLRFARLRSCVPWVFVTTICVLAIGCGESAPAGRMPLTGQVTLKGQPLDRGSVEFVSADGGKQTGGTIENGKFDIPAKFGLPAGVYTVRISSMDDAAAEGELAMPGPENMNQTAKDRIPEEYNIKSKLTAEVTASGPNVFDYDIP